MNNMITIFEKNNTFLYKKNTMCDDIITCIETEIPGFGNRLTRFSTTKNNDT